MSALTARRYALSRAVAMVRDRPGAFLLGVVLAASALALPLALASLLWATRPVVAHLKPAPEVSIFVSPRAAARDIDAMKARIAALPGVQSVSLRPKDAAFAQLLKKSGFQARPAELGGNPLPDVLIAQLTLPVSAERLERVGAEVKGWPLVDAVRSDLDWYRKVAALGRLGMMTLAFFGGLVVLLVALILIGTVRLHAGTRADEVEVLRIVGATRRFVVRPYAYSAVLTMALAAALAIACVYAAHRVLRGPIRDLAALYGASFSLQDPEPVHLVAVFLGLIVFGWLVGVLGARAGVSSALKRF